MPVYVRTRVSMCVCTHYSVRVHAGVCVYVCMLACMYGHVCVHVWVCTFMCLHTGSSACTCTHEHTRVQACVGVYMYLWAHVCMCVMSVHTPEFRVCAVSACVRVCTCACLRVHTHMCVCVHPTLGLGSGDEQTAEDHLCLPTWTALSSLNLPHRKLFSPGLSATAQGGRSRGVQSRVHLLRPPELPATPRPPQGHCPSRAERKHQWPD